MRRNISQIWKTRILRLIFGLTIIGLLSLFGYLFNIINNSWYRVFIFSIILILPSPWVKAKE